MTRTLAQATPDAVWRDLIGPLVGLIAVLAGAVLAYWAGRQERRDELSLKRLDGLDTYWRVGSEISGLRNDLEAFLVKRRLHQEAGRPDDTASYAESSLWFWARTRLEVDDFVREKGGHWYYATPDSDLEFSNAVYLIWYLTPFSLLEEGQLMMQADSSRWLPPFVQWIHDDAEGRGLIAKWLEWLSTCRCGGEPAETCEVHAMMRACDDYWRSLETTEAIVPWYQTRATLKYLRPLDLYRRFKA